MTNVIVLWADIDLTGLLHTRNKFPFLAYGGRGAAFNGASTTRFIVLPPP